MGGFFTGVLGFHKGFQVGKIHLPELAVLLKPPIDGSKRLWVEPIEAPPALAAFAHQVGAPQEPQVLRYGRPRNRKGPRDLPGGQAATAQQVENGAAGGVGEGSERRLQRICN